MTFQYSTTTVTITGAAYPIQYRVTRKQNLQKYENGAAVVFDRDQRQNFIIIEIAGTHAQHEAIRDFIRTVVLFSKYAFTLTPDAGVDIGNGVDATASVRYWSSNFIETMTQYHSYRYRMVLRYT
jgi:hypothetical protein